jgi:hypothetical protein
MDRSVLNDKSTPFQREAKDFIGRGLLGVNPYHQEADGVQEIHQPIKRGLESSEGAVPPIDQHNVVLACRMATVGRGSRASIAAAMQFQHQLDAPGTSYDDSVLFRETCKRDHRFKDAIACGSGTRGNHDVTIMV